MLLTVKLYRRYINDIIIREKNLNQLNIENMFDDSSLGLKLKRIKENKIEISYLNVNIKIIRGEYQTQVYRKYTYVLLFIHKESKEP